MQENMTEYFSEKEARERRLANYTSLPADQKKTQVLLHKKEENVWLIQNIKIPS